MKSPGAMKLAGGVSLGEISPIRLTSPACGGVPRERPAGDVAGDVAGAAELGPGHVCRGVAWGAAGGMLVRSA